MTADLIDGQAFLLPSWGRSSLVAKGRVIGFRRPWIKCGSNRAATRNLAWRSASRGEEKAFFMKRNQESLVKN